MKKVITNKQKRELMSFYDLPEKEQEYYKELESSDFFKFKGDYYSLANFMKLHDDAYWHGYCNFTYSCGLVVRTEDGQIIVGTFYA